MQCDICLMERYPHTGSKQLDGKVCTKRLTRRNSLPKIDLEENGIEECREILICLITEQSLISYWIAL